MKKVLSLLVAFVFMQVQSWALSGGPDYGTLNNSVTGTYAGVMLADIGQNGLGLFQIGMPAAGLGSGTFAFYAGGGAFFGTVVALADGDKAQMSGVLKGSLKESFTLGVIIAGGGGGGAVGGQQDVALIGGSFVAQILGSSHSGGAIGVGSRITGTGTVTVTAADAIQGVPPGINVGDTTLTLDGFQQSSAVTGTVSLSTLTGTTGSGTGG